MDKNPYLYHHGILGQKWGVRRFQNKDGSFTRKGKERYNKSKDNYDNAKNDLDKAKENYKNGTGTYHAIKNAKKRHESAKRRLDDSYSNLKKSVLADEGRELHKKGKTISRNSARIGAITSATAVAAIATNTFWKSNSSLVTKYGNIPLNTLAATTIAAGGTAVASILSVKYARENKRLKAYYNKSYRGWE